MATAASAFTEQKGKLRRTPVFSWPVQAALLDVTKNTSAGMKGRGFAGPEQGRGTGVLAAADASYKWTCD